jgi:peptidoglycan/LPS O-acetylase OafA/YrhL
MSAHLAKQDEPTAWGGAATSSDAGHFRPDIEGLRAVAILAVLLYHAGVPGFRGGFVGVDVFFVISGFLITGLLRREIVTSGTVSFSTFYARRARRLLPAALVVIAVTIAASWFILPSIDFPSVAGDGAAAALYVSNYRFALTATDYFGAEGQVSPLLHYWSLGVEEQFYLFWPVLLLVAARVLGVRRLWWLVAFVAVVSFAACVALTTLEPPWAFYSLLTRAWQLAVGGLIALGVGLNVRFGRRAAVVAALAGLALIGAAIVLISETDPYPGLTALVPVTGAALLVIAGQRPQRISTYVLGSRPARWLGKISYSLYLWHWPLLILAPLVLRNDSLVVRVGLALIAVAVADVSTRTVENPFRFGSVSRWKPSRTLAVAGVASVSVALASVALAGVLLAAAPTPTAAGTPFQLTADGKPQLPPPVLSGAVPADLSPSLAEARDDLAQSLKDGCQVAFLGVAPKPCSYGDRSSQTAVYLIGDSHAAQWLPALDALGSSRGWRILPRTKGNCPPVDTTVWLARYERPYVECDEWRRNLIDEINSVKPAMVLVSFSRGAELWDGSSHHEIQADPDAWRAAIERTLSELKSSGATPILMADTPRPAIDPVSCLATHQLIEQCPSTRDESLDADYSALEHKAAADVGVRVISANDWLCSATDCPSVMGQYLVYRDTNHLTATFSRLLSAALGWAIDHSQ